MTNDHEHCRAVILLLQAGMDGELGSAAEEAGPWREAACAERQAAFDVLRIAHAMRTRLTCYAAPTAARRRLVEKIRQARE